MWVSGRAGGGVAEGDLDHDEEAEWGPAAAIQPIAEASASTTCAASDNVTAQPSTTAGNRLGMPAPLRRRSSSPKAIDISSGTAGLIMREGDPF
jgi:hypothetical protein